MSLASLKRSVSPPPSQRKRKQLKLKQSANDDDIEPTLAAVEAGHAVVRDHVEYFSRKLARYRRESAIFPGLPSLDIREYTSIYRRNQHVQGHHFVIHQHQHPVAGVHYDLRLQFSETSSLSFAIPYGLPGNPNSKRPNRMAIETRVHCVWNHLIESASHATGSLLIWDTGEYLILPRYQKIAETDDDDLTNGDDLRDANNAASKIPQNQKLIEAFHDRHIRLRLHGTRLPPDYTIYMRLPIHNDIEAATRKPAQRRRRRFAPTKSSSLVASSDSESSPLSSSPATPASSTADDNAVANASDDEAESEAAGIVGKNAYPGATNSIGSVHQRRWFLGLDRLNSGFIKPRNGRDKGRWIRGADGTGGFDTFYVRGREVERSLLTGRLASEVLSDEGVEGFVERRMWRPIME